MKKKLFTLLLLSIPVCLMAQRSMTFDDLKNWQRITSKAISNNGQFIACKLSPWEGDEMVKLYNNQGKELAEYPSASGFEFNVSSNYLLITQKPAKALMDSLKIKKVKGKKLPMNRLIICHESGKEETIDSLKNHRLAQSANWIAYQQGRKDSTLYIRTLDGSEQFSYPAVKEYNFAKEGEVLYYVSLGDTLDTPKGLYAFNLQTKTNHLIKEGKGVFKQITFNKKGDELAFLYCEHKDSTYKAHDLWLSHNQEPARVIANRNHEAFPKGWVISENGRLNFSENNEQLFFGTAPQPQQKDSTMLDEYRPLVHIWNWNEHTPYTVQEYDRKEDLKRTYQAVFNLNTHKLLQLATPDYPQVTLTRSGNSNTILLYTTLPYPVTAMWEGSYRKDYYALSTDTGEKKLLKKGIQDRMLLSPQGKYAYWYAAADSCWRSIDLQTGIERQLTEPGTFAAWDEDFDNPAHPNAYGVAGWTQNDTYLLVYERYDIWQIDPAGRSPMLNLTRNGREKSISYRYVQLDKDAHFIDTNKPQMLQGFNRKTKGSGFYSANLSRPAAPKPLHEGNFVLKGLVKAKDAHKVLYTQETYTEYPDIHFADISFKKPIRLTNGGNQQNGITWGNAELVSWLSFDGIPLEGLVFKPANFDPTKKYPLIVNFYERNSDGLYNYHTPEPHRSTIDYHFYNSHDYIIFNPDVHYKTGYPGEDCFNCVMPGIAKLIGEGYIDEKAIGAQGHSWGGYQVAYLATRTHLFAAIESGAPVVNMFSAYGGIRWGSGRSRTYQYEMGQSRIGDSPWNVPLRYLENSPLMTMDKVQTPILIMHNDQDGHVPWYQGIEYFNALKRLGKPAWLLNYTGEIHWPGRMANRVDFQKRMFQFFNHYLKKEPMPKWMKEGVKAVDRDFELGYE